MVWHFIGVYIINRTLHDRLEIQNLSSRVEKYFTRSLRSLVKYFSTLEEKFRISARPCNILYILPSLVTSPSFIFSAKHGLKTHNAFAMILAELRAPQAGARSPMGKRN